MSTPAHGMDDLGGPELPPDELLAAEYVLGVLDWGTRLSAEARTLADPAFAELVSRWQRRMVPLSFDLPPVDVPNRVWVRLQERLGWSTPAAVQPAGARLALWRLTAGVAATIALALIAVDFAPRWTAHRPAEAQLTKAVTTLAHDDGTAGWLATVDAAHGTVSMVPVPGVPDAQGRAAELWLIPPGQAPRSLGAISFDRAHTVPVPAKWRADLTGQALLAVTLEPPAGIPHAAPTGPVIAKGAVRL
jgi:anti-sigma-K factor RskA